MTMDPPKLQQDPMFGQLQAQAQRDQTLALQQQAQGDTASLLARYGTRLALAQGTVATPAASVGTSVPSPFGAGTRDGFDLASIAKMFAGKAA